MSIARYQEVKKKSAAFDVALFSRYRAAYVDILNVVAPDPESVELEQKRFLAGAIENPSFTYHQQQSIDYTARVDAFEKLAFDLESDRSMPELVVTAYRDAIAGQLQVIGVAQTIQAFTQTNNRDRFATAFSAQMATLFGTPKRETFADLLGCCKSKLSRVPANLRANPRGQRMQELTRGYVRVYDPPYVQPPTDIVTGADPITKSSVLARSLKDYLAALGIRDWSVVVSSYSQNIRVVPHAQCVWVPNDAKLAVRAKPLTPNALLGLIAHEIGTHVVRQARGAASQLQLLSLGLAGYEAGEEGLAMYREQQFTGFTDFAGVEAYRAAGLAYGLDGHEPRSFRHVFEVLVDYFLIVRQVDTETAQILAWKRCLRTFRGTPGGIPGCVFTKDIVYRDGNIATWVQMQDGTYNGIDLDAGKFDQTNPDHRALVCELAQVSR